MEEEQARYEPQAHAIQEFYGGAILAACMAKTFGTRVDSAAFKVHLDNILAAAGAPTDAIEVMMVQQLAWAHARLGDLHARAAHAESLEAADIYNAAAVRLMAEFRKASLALRDYRMPVAPRNVTLVGQQNVAAGDQQVALFEAGAAVERSQKNSRDSELGGKAQEAISYEPQTDFLAESQTGGGRAAERVEARPFDAGGARAASASGIPEPAMGAFDWA